MRRILLVISFALLSSAIAVTETSKNPREEFEQKYIAWRDYISSHPEFRVMSIATSQFTCPQFKDIVKLGPDTLPYIVQKIEEDPNGQYLWMAIDRIAKVRIYAKYDEVKKETVFPDFPDVKPKENIYVYWWREGHKSTPSLFQKRHTKLKELRMQKKDKEANIEYRKIIDLGIDALPCMIEEVEKGDMELISVISFLTDGKVEPDASIEQCVSWWEKNRQHWLIPFPNKQPKANAGKDQIVTAGDVVKLDASDSNDPDNDRLEFSWRQTAGPNVNLDDPNNAKPKFTAPVVDKQTVLTFQLIVNDGSPKKSVHPDCESGQSEPALVNITIKPEE
jgi:hypothetical protein